MTTEKKKARQAGKYIKVLQLAATGETMTDACKKAKVSSPAFYAWQKKNRNLANKVSKALEERKSLKGIVPEEIRNGMSAKPTKKSKTRKTSNRKKVAIEALTSDPQTSDEMLIETLQHQLQSQRELTNGLLQLIGRVTNQ